MEQFRNDYTTINHPLSRKTFENDWLNRENDLIIISRQKHLSLYQEPNLRVLTWHYIKKNDKFYLGFGYEMEISGDKDSLIYLRKHMFGNYLSIVTNDKEDQKKFLRSFLDKSYIINQVSPRIFHTPKSNYNEDNYLDLNLLKENGEKVTNLNQLKEIFNHPNLDYVFEG